MWRPKSVSRTTARRRAIWGHLSAALGLAMSVLASGQGLQLWLISKGTGGVGGEYGDSVKLGQ